MKLESSEETAQVEMLVMRNNEEKFWPILLNGQILVDLNP